MLKENVLCIINKPADEVIQLYVDDKISYTVLSCYMTHNGFNLQRDFDWNRIYMSHLSNKLKKLQPIAV